MKVCIIEDDRNFARLLKCWADLAKFDAQVFHNLDVALAQIDDDVDCVLIDWHIGTATAERGIIELRQKLGWDFSIIVITGSDIDELVVKALHLGADDFVLKPVRMSELLARIQACWRRSKDQVDVIERGKYSLSLSERSIKLNGESIRLTQKEFDLISLFFQHPTRVLTRAFIFQRVWGRSNYESRTLDTHVSSLKSKLSLGTTGVDIVAIPKIGYQLVT